MSHVTPAISVKGLVKRYGDRNVVDGLDLEVHAGEVLAFLGRNGAGKTTTTEILEGYRERDGGEVLVLGQDPASAGADWRARLGIVLQESRPLGALTVRETLRLYAAYFPHPRGVDEVISLVGLEEQADQRAGRLSGGQQRRLDVGVARIGNPELVFLDEMTTGLDPAARRVAWDLVRRVRDMGTTVVLVTHFMEEAERLCDRIAVMDAGRIVAEGAPQKLVTDYAEYLTVVFSTDAPDVEFLAGVPHVDKVMRHGSRVEVRGDGAVLAHVACSLVAHDITPPDLRVELPTLEDVFLALTGHAMEE